MLKLHWTLALLAIAHSLTAQVNSYREVTTPFSCLPLGGQARACVARSGELLSYRGKNGVEYLAGDTYYLYFYNACGNLSDTQWLAPNVSQPNGPNTFPLTITRRTPVMSNEMCDPYLGPDQYEIRQVFSRNTTEGSLTIRSTVKYIGKRRFVSGSFCRLADLNVLDMQRGTYTSPFVATERNVITVSRADPFHGVGITTNGDSRLTGIAYMSYGFGCGFDAFSGAQLAAKGIVTEDIDAQAVAGQYIGGRSSVATLEVTYKAY